MLSGYFLQHSGVNKLTLSSFLIQDVAEIKNVSCIGLKRIAFLLAVGWIRDSRHTYAFSAFCFERKFSSCADIWHMKFNSPSHDVNPLSWARKCEKEIYIFLTGIEFFLFWVSLSSLNQNLYQATKTPVSQLIVSNAHYTVNWMSSLRMVQDFYESYTLSVPKTPRSPWVTSYIMHHTSPAYTFLFCCLLAVHIGEKAPAALVNQRRLDVKSSVGGVLHELTYLRVLSSQHLSCASWLICTFFSVCLLNTVSQRMLYLMIEGFLLFALFPSSFRGVGCILYEMATGRPMFPGATVKEELHLIFRLIGKTSVHLPHIPHARLKT